MNWYLIEGDTVAVRLHVQPGAKKTGVAGLHGEALKIRLAAPPVDGKANAVWCAFLADCFQVASRQVSIVSGLASRQKRIDVRGSALPDRALLGSCKVSN